MSRIINILRKIVKNIINFFIRTYSHCAMIQSSSLYIFLVFTIKKNIFTHVSEFPIYSRTEILSILSILDSYTLSILLRPINTYRNGNILYSSTSIVNFRLGCSQLRLLVKLLPSILLNNERIINIPTP